MGWGEEVDDEGGQPDRGHTHIVVAGGRVGVEVHDVKVTTTNDIGFYDETVFGGIKRWEGIKCFLGE